LQDFQPTASGQSSIPMTLIFAKIEKGPCKAMPIEK
jgi:hypothetical protein